MPNFANILNSLLQNFSTPVIRRFFIRLLILSSFLLYGSEITAQVSGGFQFDPLDKKGTQKNREELLRNQEIFWVKKLIRQEILLKEMERIRVETNKIMKEISKLIKGEGQNLEGELTKLQDETIRVNQEIVAELKKINEGFLEGREVVRRKLESMRKESKSLVREIAFILEYEKEIWQKKQNLQDSLLQTNGELTAPQSKSGKVLKSNVFSNKEPELDEVITILDPQDESFKDNKPSPKNRFEKTIDSSRNEPKVDYQKGKQDNKGLLEPLKDESTEKLPQQNKNILEKDKDKETAKAKLEEQKQKIIDFGSQIKILRKKVKAKSGNASKEFIELGNKYLETQRFIDSLDDLEKLALLTFSNQNNIHLGSYEQAAWAFKIALTFNRNQGETHLTIGKIYDEISDGKNAIMYARLANLVFIKKNNQAKMQEAQSFIESIEKKYDDKNQ